jgi:hypothetical protein
MNNEFPNPTPRMVFSAAAIIFFIVLTMLVPMWLFIPLFVAVISGIAYGVCSVLYVLDHNEWRL